MRAEYVWRLLNCLSKGFNVKSQSNKELWSGCSGIELERWASAFYAKEEGGAGYVA